MRSLWALAAALAALGGGLACGPSEAVSPSSPAPPPPTAATDPSEPVSRPRELVIVLDTSASLRGPPLRRAQGAAGALLAALGPDDTFQILRGGDWSSVLAPGLVAARRENVARARDWLAAIEADGSPALAPGVGAALDLPHDPGRERVIALFTDGRLGEDDRAAVRADLGRRLGGGRVLAFGVGTAIDRPLLEELAALGGGTVRVDRPPAPEPASAAPAAPAAGRAPVWVAHAGAPGAWGGEPPPEPAAAAPIIRIGAAPILLGARDKWMIRRYVKEQIPRVRHCYEQELQQNPALAGTVTASFVIGPDGDVLEAIATGMDHEALEACIAEVVRSIRFPPVAGEVDRINYPFTLERSDP